MCRTARITIAVTIGIGIVGILNAFVNIVVTVVIQSVAKLRSSRIDRVIGIITIGIVGYISGWCRTGLYRTARITIAITIGIGIVSILNAFIDIAIAVIVDAVTELRSTWIDRVISIITIAIVDYISGWC